MRVPPPLKNDQVHFSPARLVDAPKTHFPRGLLMRVKKRASRALFSAVWHGVQCK
jgi:hypothetical protein